MAKKKLYKSKTNFTLKRMHQSGSYGKIFERDYTTITNKSASPEGYISIYSSPSFKMTINAGFNGQKKYRYGGWLNNPNSCGDSNSWTLACMPSPDKNDNKIILKPNSKRLTDFVCYSSALELIKASISDIIFKFPGELYVTDKTLDELGVFQNNLLDTNSDLWRKRQIMKDYYLIDNPLLIDIIQKVPPKDTNLSNLKFFCKSHKDYEFIDVNSKKDGIKDWKVTPGESRNCILNGDEIATVALFDVNNNRLIEIKCYNFNKEIIYVSDKRGRIRPNEEKINEFFNNLDDFQKIILNQCTNYTAKFETYEEDEEIGWYYNEKKYKWPTSDGDYNLAVKGLNYNNYIDKLTKLAYGYDELYTDAIWRMMTHEAISNMDLTIYKNGENLTPNSSKLKKMLNIVGRQFDEIKKYVDNIKNTNNVTYEQENNVPDYFLSDSLDLSGWEVKEILNEIPDDEITEPMYSGRTIGFTPNDANNDFIRKLKLNSKNILSKKGTKQAIEDLMGIFGFHSTDWLKKYYGELRSEHLRNAYIIVENVYIANGYGYNKTPDDMLNEVKRINQLKDNFEIDGIENDEPLDEFQGIPVTEAILNLDKYYSWDEAKGEYILLNDKPLDSTNNNTDIVTSIPEIKTKKYLKINCDVSRLIPWFDKDKDYDTKIYFQSKGGWSRNTGSEGYVLLENTPDDATNENTLKVRSLPKLKNENYKYLLKVNDYYIWDKITTNSYYEQTISKINYVSTINNLYELPYNTIKEEELYYVGDEKKYYKIRDIENHGNPEEWVEVTDEDEILKFENTIDSNKGNNPHTGDYDGGENYIDAFQKIFEKSKFEYSRNDETEGYLNYGFDIKILPDSNKCLFFDENQTLISSSGNLRGSRIKPYNFFDETDTEGTKESAALSIINSKELHIVFDISNQKFIEKDVLPYIKQLIPSTTIFSYSFEYIESDDRIFEARIQEKICNNSSCSLLGVI